MISLTKDDFVLAKSKNNSSFRPVEIYSLFLENYRIEHMWRKEVIRPLDSTMIYSILRNYFSNLCHSK